MKLYLAPCLDGHDSFCDLILFLFSHSLCLIMKVKNDFRLEKEVDEQESSQRQIMYKTYFSLTVLVHYSFALGCRN